MIFCLFLQLRSCGMFRWEDEVNKDELISVPKCRCGAGFCRQLIDSRGMYFACPIKKVVFFCFITNTSCFLHLFNTWTCKSNSKLFSMHGLLSTFNSHPLLLLSYIWFANYLSKSDGCAYCYNLAQKLVLIEQVQ